MQRENLHRAIIPVAKYAIMTKRKVGIQVKIISWNNLSEANSIINQELMFYEMESPEFARLTEISEKLNQLLKDYKSEENL